MADQIVSRAPKTVEEMVIAVEALWHAFPDGIPQGAGIMPTHEFMHDLCARLIALEYGELRNG